MPNGIPRSAALAAVDRPAAILGLDKRVGKIAPGADGQLVLMNEDPLSVTSVVEHVVVDGKHVYDRSKDVRVRQLLDGTVGRARRPRTPATRSGAATVMTAPTPRTTTRRTADRRQEASPCAALLPSERLGARRECPRG